MEGGAAGSPALGEGERAPWFLPNVVKNQHNNCMGAQAKPPGMGAGGGIWVPTEIWGRSRGLLEHDFRPEHPYLAMGV